MIALDGSRNTTLNLNITNTRTITHSRTLFNRWTHANTKTRPIQIFRNRLNITVRGLSAARSERLAPHSVCNTVHMKA
jgi:hypothetical protein